MFQVIAIAAAVILTLVVLRFFQSTSRGPSEASVGEEALPPTSAKILVSGWRTAELSEILVKFGSLYELPESAWKVQSATAYDLEVSFPHGISPGTLFYLVNYIHYPHDFDLRNRQLAAVAEIHLSNSTGIPDGASPGERAWIYVPENDTEHDLTYVMVSDGTAFEVSFTDMRWRRQETSRLSAEARRVMDEMEAKELQH